MIWSSGLSSIKVPRIIDSKSQVSAAHNEQPFDLSNTRCLGLGDMKFGKMKTLAIAKSRTDDALNNQVPHDVTDCADILVS